MRYTLCTVRYTLCTRVLFYVHSSTEPRFPRGSHTVSLGLLPGGHHAPFTFSKTKNKPNHTQLRCSLILYTKTQAQQESGFPGADLTKIHTKLWKHWRELKSLIESVIRCRGRVKAKSIFRLPSVCCFSANNRSAQWRANSAGRRPGGALGWLAAFGRKNVL